MKSLKSKTFVNCVDHFKPIQKGNGKTLKRLFSRTFLRYYLHFPNFPSPSFRFQITVLYSSLRGSNRLIVSLSTQIVIVPTRNKKRSPQYPQQLPTSPKRIFLNFPRIVIPTYQHLFIANSSHYFTRFYTI